MLICCGSVNRYERTIKKNKVKGLGERKGGGGIQPQVAWTFSRILKCSYFPVIVMVYPHPMVFLMALS